MSTSSESADTPSLRRNVAWALVGNLGYSACQWGVLVCMAKLGTATDVGRFALGLALTAPVITLTNLNLRLLQSTDAREDYPFSVYLSVRLIGTVLGLAAIAAMAFGLGYQGVTLYLILAVALAKVFVAAIQPMLALGAAVNPRLARHFVRDLGAFRRLRARTMLIAGGLGLLGIAACTLFGRPMLTLFYAPEYARHAVVLVWLAVATAVAFLAQALSYAVTAARRLPEQLPIAVLSLVVCFLASQYLVPRYGLLGAAWAVLATEASRLACLAGVYAAAIAGASSAASRPRGRAASLRGPRSGHAPEERGPSPSLPARPGATEPKAPPLIAEITG